MTKRQLAAAAFALSAWCAAAEARTWTALYAFGDSYTDSGAGYVDGNGPTAVVYLAQRLGIAFTFAGDPKAEGKSLNFAVSGARTGASEGVKMRPADAACGTGEVLIRRGMQSQVADFSRRVASGSVRFDPETTLFFLAGGLNDEVTAETTAANLESEIRALYAQGGRYFLVALLPRKIPEFAKPGARLNAALARIPRDLRSALPGIHIELSRWGEYFDRVREDPAPYGITNASDRCAGRALYGEDPTPCADPDAHFYFHGGHPSTAVHRIVGREMEREIAELFP
jgi:cholinesterase